MNLSVTQDIPSTERHFSSLVRSCNPRFASFATLCLIAAASVGASPQARAQRAGAAIVSPTTKPETVSVSQVFQQVAYDAARLGPLLLIPTRSERMRELPAAPQDAPSWSLGSLGLALDRKAMPAGTISVLAPRRMTEIVSHPGAANPYLGLRPDDLIKMLLGSFSPSQWQSIESAAGIGYIDLADSQKQMYDQLIPDGVTFSQRTVAFSAGNPSPTIQSQDRNDIERTSVRLRLNRTVDLQMNYQGSQAAQGTAFIVDTTNPAPGQPRIAMNEPGSPAGPQEDARKSAYGAMLVREAPNRQKPSQLDYEAATLNPRVDLSGLTEQSTLGDLVRRVSAVTHLDVVADRRVRTLPVLLLGGGGARAGDLLKAAALAVTGTYRRIGQTNTFALTTDIDGTGAGVTNLELWAERADADRQRLLNVSADAIRKADPLAHVTFVEGDPVAPSLEIVQSIENDYRHTRYGNGPTQSVSALPPALQEKVRRYGDEFGQAGPALDTNQVRLELRLDLTLLIPGIGPIEHGNTTTFGLDARAVREAVFTEPENPKFSTGNSAKAPAPDWTWLNAPDFQRALLFTPADLDEATAIIRAARRHGFNRIWLQAGLLHPDKSRDLLSAEAAEARRQQMPLTASVSLLRDNGLTPSLAEPERTILGQTGEQFSDDYIQRQIERDDLKPDSYGRDALIGNVRPRYSGWNAPGAPDLMDRVTTIAETPGLAGLVITGISPPGFVRLQNPYGTGILTGGELGYTDARRVAFLHAEGIDPVDVFTPPSLLNGVDFDLPFFGEDAAQPGAGNGSRDLWDKFRDAESRQRLIDLYGRIRLVRPDLPLWINDRGGWFQSWDAADRLPNNTFFNAPSATARAGVKAQAERALSQWNVIPFTPDYLARLAAGFPDYTARSFKDGWDGIVFDFRGLSDSRILEWMKDTPEAPK